MIIPINNSSDEELEVQLEPWLDIVTLQPGEMAILDVTAQTTFKGLSIDYNNCGRLLLHVGGDAKLTKSS